MICRSCLRRASALRINRISHPIRNLSTTLHRLTPETTSLPETRTTPAAATSTGLAQPFSNPLTPSPGAAVKAKAKLVIPDSIAPAGTPLTGLNYLKGRDDPLALEESEYPEWLWRVLDKQADASGDDAAGDEFCTFLSFSPSFPFYLALLAIRISANGNAQPNRKNSVAKQRNRNGNSRHGFKHRGT